MIRKHGVKLGRKVGVFFLREISLEQLTIDLRAERNSIAGSELALFEHQNKEKQA